MSISVSGYSKYGFTQVSNFELAGNLEKDLYRIYHDGNHYVASKCYNRAPMDSRRGKAVLSEVDLAFDDAYFEALKSGLHAPKKYRKNDSNKFVKFVSDKLSTRFPSIDINEYVCERIDYKAHILHLRVKRFRRKAYLNKWTHFVTFTYDDKLCTEEEFKTKLRRCLSNLKVRKGWKYMGVFERAPETQRLHFHGIFYIPDGEMVGKITKQTYYSVEHKKMQTSFNNSFFAKRFGRSDFRPINDAMFKNGSAIDYMLKYLVKDNNRIVYSRGVASELCKELDRCEFATEFMDFVAKFVVFDDVIDWERDIVKFTPTQLSFLPQKNKLTS